jgi:hypothetical protein
MLGFRVEKGACLQDDFSIIRAFKALNRLDGFATHQIATISAHVVSLNSFEGRTGLEYPADDPETEATHMAWLENELAKRNLCPNGYKITDKTEIAAAGGEVIGQTYNMAYAGVCK